MIGGSRLPALPSRLSLPDAIVALNDRLRRIDGLVPAAAPSPASTTGTTTSGLQSPLDFGAAGDGTADDSAAVSKAIAACGYLWLPAGKVFVTAQVTITQYGFECFGGGELLLKPGAGTDLMVLDGSQYTGGTFPGNGLYARIHGVTLHGNAANQPVNLGACLVLRNAAYTVVQGCLVYAGSGDGIRLENHNENYNADEINIISNFIFSNGRHGIYMLPTLDPVSTTIAASIAAGTRTVMPASMVNVSVGSTFVVANAGGSNSEWVVVTAVTPTAFTAVFASSKTGPGITVNTVWGRPADHVIIGNHVNYNGRAGIRGTRLTSTIIAQNNVLTNAVGIELDAPDRCSLLGNCTRNNKGSGIIIEDDQTGNGFGRANDILIEGNQIHYNGIQTTADELDVFQADAVVIKGNYLGDTDFTAHAQYGIQLSNCTAVVMEGNDFGPTVHGPLLCPNTMYYRSLNNIGLADGMQGTWTAFGGMPGTPAPNDYGVLYTVTDYGHTLLWIGTQWVFAPADAGSGWIVNSAGGVITGGVWAPCDGSLTSILEGGGTMLAITTPNLGAGYYMRR